MNTFDKALANNFEKFDYRLLKLEFIKSFLLADGWKQEDERGKKYYASYYYEGKEGFRTWFDIPISLPDDAAYSNKIKNLLDHLALIYDLDRLELIQMIYNHFFSSIGKDSTNEYRPTV